MKIQSDTFSLLFSERERSWFINIKPPSQIKTLSAVTASLQIRRERGVSSAPALPLPSATAAAEGSSTGRWWFHTLLLCHSARPSRLRASDRWMGFQAPAPARGAGGEGGDAGEEQRDSRPLGRLAEGSPSPDVGQLEHRFLAKAASAPGTQKYRGPGAGRVAKELPGRAGDGQGRATRLTAGLHDAWALCTPIL